MDFKLTMSLDNAEAEEMGPDLAIPEYLERVSARARDGFRQGNVLDGNGNIIGQWEITP